jgi:hypothetical protein
VSAGRFWLCWSPSQQAVHIEDEADGCENNLRAFVLNQPVDFVPLAVFDTHNAASKFALHIQEMRNRRQGGAASWN